MSRNSWLAAYAIVATVGWLRNWSRRIKAERKAKYYKRLTIMIGQDRNDIAQENQMLENRIEEMNKTWGAYL